MIPLMLMDGRTEYVRSLMQHNVSVNVSQGRCMVPLHMTTALNDDILVALSLPHGVFVDDLNDTYRVPMHPQG